MIIRKAELRDLDRIWQIMTEAVSMMKREGRLQWDETYPRPETIIEDISKSVGYVLCEGEIISAYAALVFDGEEAYDHLLEGQWLSEEDYLVLHRIAVADEYKHQGVARRFFLEAESLAGKAGIRSFRVDTNYDNNYMLRLLSSLGFSYTGVCQYSRGTRLCFEKLL